MKNCDGVFHIMALHIHIMAIHTVQCGSSCNRDSGLWYALSRADTIGR